MCFIVDPNHNEISITAKYEKLSIIKRVLVTLSPDGSISIRSPHKLYTYYEGHVDDYKGVRGELDEHLKIIDDKVYKGFHSYIYPHIDIFSPLHVETSYSEATMYIDLFGTIPPNSEYLIDPIFGEFVSNKIKVTNRMSMFDEKGKLILSIHKLYEYISDTFNW